MADIKNEIEKASGIETIIDHLLKTPGIKVNREKFLTGKFAKITDEKQLIEILETGPYAAGIKKSNIDNIAKATVQKRTLISTGISTAAGLPGGLAMAATIPADIAQFFGNSLRMAQELAYLYGHEDLWLDEHLDTEKARNRMIIFLGAMLGVGGSSSALKLAAPGVAKTILKKVPQIALTKTVYYPIVKRISSYIGVEITKRTFASGLSKAVPVVGGVISGTITFTIMRPMGKRLAKTLSESLLLTNKDVMEEYEIIKKEFPEVDNMKFEKEADKSMLFSDE
ncbi:hypothetical protein [Sporosarcina newyorkensis]|nr:hypothetical protein [Sporosarcina newyorkensis]